MDSFDDAIKELATIRKLLILALLNSGLTQDELGAALGVHGTTIGRMFPKGALRAVARKASANG
mgnify:FL=1